MSAVLYAPKLLPGLKVELIEEEQLVLVRSRPKDGGPPAARRLRPCRLGGRNSPRSEALAPPLSASRD